MDCNLAADLLSKFSQWSVETQITAMLFAGAVVIGLAYLAHETLIKITHHIVCCIQLERGKQERKAWAKEK